MIVFIATIRKQYYNSCTLVKINLCDRIRLVKNISKCQALSP